MKPLYTYTDYRAFLVDWFESKRQASPALTHRAFCATAGIDGSAYLCRVLNGTRKLSPTYVDRFVKALDLSPREAAYFGLMVRFGTTRRLAEKEECLRAMISLRDVTSAYRIEDRKLRFYDKWYYPVIRELVACTDTPDDFNLLASMTVPRITPAQAKSAVHFLMVNGFLSRDETGKYVVQEPVITTGDDVNSTLVRRYHRTTLQQTSQLLDEIDPSQRDVSSLMLNVSKATYHRMREEIRLFRKKLLAIAAADTSKSEMVGFVGMQLMPRSRSATRRRRS